MQSNENSDGQIADITQYNERMSKSLIDKIFFMDKTDANFFVDIGCADGALIACLNKLFPEHQYVGCDINPKMIEAAKARNIGDNVKFFTSVDEAMNSFISVMPHTCVILSSMIHEVYSYGKAGPFWDFLRFDPGYIAIRDMCVSKTCSRPSDPVSVMKVRQTYDRSLIDQWESCWGSLDENWSLTHFLLKYRYKDTWARELKENYLPVNKEELIQIFPATYRPIFVNHYTLPFIRNCVARDFNIDLQERTHLQLIMQLSTSMEKLDWRVTQ